MRVRTLPLGDKNITGSKIKQIRKNKGLKQKDLTMLLEKHGVKMTISVLSKIESQIRLLTDIEIVALSKALEVPVGQLLGLE